MSRLRHASCRPGGSGGSGGRVPGPAAGTPARRFAQGKIDEDEYWSRLSILNETRKDVP